MSGVAAIFHRDGRPVAEEPLGRMAAALAHRGPDGASQVLRPPFALACQQFWTTPEEVGERQPATAEGGRFQLLFDGRLDNRDELLTTLGGPADRSDASLLLAGYRRWGEELFPRLLGPFALVLCDRRERRVVCARDPLGDRTLFYHLDGRRLLVASEEAALLAVPEIVPDPDEGRLAAFFALSPPEDGRTFFAALTELLPGHLLAVGEREDRRCRYWRPALGRERDERSDAEHGERFRELLAASVAARLRAPAPPAVMMSGGLDSTAIAALASAELTGARPPRPARCVSWIFDELSTCDERPFIRSVVERHGLDALEVAGDDAWPLVEGGAAWRPATPEETPYRELKRRTYQTAASAGSSVLLNGGSADLLYADVGGWLAELVRAGRWVEAARSAAAEVGRRGLRRGLAGLRSGLQPRRAAAVPPPPWLTAAARRELPEPAPLHPDLAAARYPARAARLYGAREARSITLEIGPASRCGVELRHPYRDRRLIEYILDVPARQLYRLGRYKQVARVALEGLLPREVVERERPTLLTPLFRRGLWEKERARVEALLVSSDAEWPRFVRPEWVERVWSHGARRPSEEVVLWHCVSFELWRRRGKGWG